MPEGDAVRRTARRLDLALVGQELTVGQLRVPSFATVDLAGSAVVGTVAVGKHLLTRLRRRDRPVTLHSHLRMDGRWVTGAAGSRPCAGPAHQVRVWLQSVTDQAVGLRLAEVKVVPTEQEQTLVGHLGPDVLAEDFDLELAVARLQAEPGRPVGLALLDQTRIAGLGTMWVSEACFLARAHPEAQVGTVSDLGAALDQVQSDMIAALTDSKPAARRRLRVYARDRQPCPRCGTMLRTVRVGRPSTDRQLYLCPRCQA